MMKRPLAVLALGLAITAASDARAQEADAVDRLNSLDSLSGVNSGTAGRPGWCMPVGATQGHTVVRLHTQLLVTGVSCGELYRMPDAYERYLAFTNTHEDILLDARADIERNARATGRPATEAYDAVRTEIANLEADIISQRGVNLYCTMRQSRFNSLIGASEDSFRLYARDVHGRNVASGRQCLSMAD